EGLAAVGPVREDAAGAGEAAGRDGRGGRRGGRGRGRGPPAAPPPPPRGRGRWAPAGRLTRYFPGDEVDRHFALLPERYLRATDAARLTSHFRLVRSRGVRPAAFEWADRGDGRGTELTVTAEDRPGFFALLAGPLTAP